jgi:hypothetical protein
LTTCSAIGHCVPATSISATPGGGEQDCPPLVVAADDVAVVAADDVAVVAADDVVVVAADEVAVAAAADELGGLPFTSCAVSATREAPANAVSTPTTAGLASTGTNTVDALALSWVQVGSLRRSLPMPENGPPKIASERSHEPSDCWTMTIVPERSTQAFGFTATVIPHPRRHQLWVRCRRRE